MAADSYSSSGGWAGGSALQNTGQVLGSYMQKVKTYDPASGGITTATPSTVNTPAASSSLARVVNAPQNTAPAATAQATAVPSPVQSYVAPVQTAAAVPAGMAMAQGRDARAVAGAPGVVAPAAAAKPADTMANYLTGGKNNAAVYAYDPTSGRYVTKATLTSDYSHSIQSMTYTDASGAMLYGLDAQNAWRAASANATQGQNQMYQQTDGNMALAKVNANQAGVLDAYHAQQTAATADMSDLRAQGIAAADKARQVAAQAAADRASAFTLTGALQAPNTAEIDAAASNDMGRVASQYAGYGGGVDSGFYGYLGQRDLTTQASVNKVAHDTAYAKSANANYNTFVTALKAQQQATGSATAQRLQYDMQGVSDAIDKLSQQATQLGEGAATKLNGSIIQVRDGLQKYNNAVKEYGADSSQAVGAATSILSMASSFAAAGV